MHESLELVLKTTDLAKAGNLFSIPDKDIADDCSSALLLIGDIIGRSDYVNTDGIQSVVEICVTRITSAIRETNTIECHIEALVKLLQICLEFDLQSPSVRPDAESPHAKVVSDILSCIFQNYSKDKVMELAAPVTVLFLEKNNSELTRNVTSYLNLAMINHAHLVSPHVSSVLKSISQGNKGLIKILPTLYDNGAEHICSELSGMVTLLSHPNLVTEEKITVYEILVKICYRKPKLVVPHLPVLADHIATPEYSNYILSMFEQIAKDSTNSCLDYKEQLMEVAKGNPSTAPQVAKIMGRIGRLNEVEAEECIDYLGNQLGSADTSYLPLLLQQLLQIGIKFPDLLKTHMDTVAKFGESKEVEVKRLVNRLLELLDIKSPDIHTGGASARVDSKGSLTRPTALSNKRHTNDKVSPSHDVIVKSRPAARPHSLTSASSDQTPSQDRPYPDAVYQFCEKHMPTIKSYIEKISAILPLPVKCTVEEKKTKKYRYVRLYFGCHKKDKSCLYSAQNFFTLKSRHPKFWIHLMFLNLQAKSAVALRQQDNSVAALGKCWNYLQMDRSDSFLRLVTSSFPTQKERDLLGQELWDARFYDVISLEPISKQWTCFMCSNPERLSGFIRADGTPGIAGQLKEKKGKWKLFKRWKKRHFTLSGDNITYQKTANKLETLSVNQIESVRACRKKPRDVPRAFEIFTEDGSSYKFKSNDHKNVERWVQCLNLALSKSKKSGRYHTVG